MLPHPETAAAVAFACHDELLTLAAREPLAGLAAPARRLSPVAWLQVRAGAVLIALGTGLQGRSNGRPVSLPTTALGVVP